MAKIEDTPGNLAICLKGNCDTCPSYPKGSGEGLYCVRGAGKAEIARHGCNCPDCPIWIDNGLTGLYYCAAKRKD